MNWLLSLGSGFLTSKLSGWIALAAVSVVFVIWWRLDYLGDQLAACRADAYVATRENPELEKLTDELKQTETDRYDELRRILDSAEHPCLDWVYDPNGQDAQSPSVRNPGEGE